MIVYNIMYAVLLTLHSLTRWLVLISLVFAIFWSYRGWLQKKQFSKFDNQVRIIATSFAHLQFVLGISLYFVSPVISYFLHNFGTAVHERVIRFFGMEHITVMVIAVGVITVGSAKVKRLENDTEKFKTLAIWFTVALLIIFSSIPWSFSPLISRPNFRWF